jgi:hypothetical protein
VVYGDLALVRAVSHVNEPCGGAAERTLKKLLLKNKAPCSTD